MLDGTTHKETFYLLSSNSAPNNNAVDLPSLIKACCENFKLKVLAHDTDADEMKNDKSGFIQYFSQDIIDANYFLYKSNGSEFEHIADLNDDTYGTLSQFGFFTNEQQEKFIQYQIDWRKVLIAFGTGKYLIRCTKTTGIGSVSYDIDSLHYCLYKYTAAIANNTVRLEYYLSGVTGIVGDDTKCKDYGTLSFYNQYRLPGFFGYPTTPFTTSYVKYNSGQRKFVEDSQEPEYILKLKQLDFYIHEILRIEVLMADQILVTDYNNKNAGSFIQKSIQKSGDYAPSWNKLKSKLADVEVKVRQEYNNLTKYRG